MNRFLTSCLLVLATLPLAACNSKGTSAPAPLNVSVATGDTSATVTWDMLPGVNYWVFRAASSSITAQSCFSTSQCKVSMAATSPLIISGLTNGTTYSIVINGRKDGGPGGPDSPSLSIVPRLAGAIWTQGAATSAGTASLNGVTYGTNFVAVGDGGALYSSSDGKIWAALTNPSPSADLKAITYASGKYVAVGTGGTILTSTDAITWTAQTSGTSNSLRAVGGNGAGGFVATGDTGTIIQSNDAFTWSVRTSNTIAPLYGITYANSRYIAVGSTGTLLSSLDNGTTWTPLSSTGNTLRGIAYGVPVDVTGAVGIFTAMGDSGALRTSSDGATWTTQTPISASQINAVTFGRQFVAVANDGNIYNSTDGINWSTVSPVVTTSALYAVTRGVYDYSAVGSGGINLYSK